MLLVIKKYKIFLDKLFLLTLNSFKPTIVLRLKSINRFTHCSLFYFQLEYSDVAVKKALRQAPVSRTAQQILSLY